MVLWLQPYASSAVYPKAVILLTEKQHCLLIIFDVFKCAYSVMLKVTLPSCLRSSPMTTQPPCLRSCPMTTQPS